MGVISSYLNWPENSNWPIFAVEMHRSCSPSYKLISLYNRVHPCERFAANVAGRRRATNCCCWSLLINVDADNFDVDGPSRSREVMRRVPIHRDEWLTMVYVKFHDNDNYFSFD